MIGLSMDHIIERIATAYATGIRMFQISMPSWGALDASEAMLFFKTVCGRFPDCRFLHYNLRRAKRIIDGSEYSSIAEAVPNVVATKNSSYDYNRTADLMINAPELQHFLLEGNYATGCTLGECSLLCSYDGNSLRQPGNSTRRVLRKICRNCFALHGSSGNLNRNSLVIVPAT